MKIGFVIYGDLETVSGGYYYDRRLIASLREHGDSVELISLARRAYLLQLTDNSHLRLGNARVHARRGAPRRSEAEELYFDILIEDELTHPSLVAANREHLPYPRVALVHHLRSSEPASKVARALYRMVEGLSLRPLDGFVCNSRSTDRAVRELLGGSSPSLVAPPPCDRFGAPISEAAIRARAGQPGPLRLVFLGNVIQRKGLQTLLNAMRLLPTGLCSLDVVGSLEMEAGYSIRMQALARRLPDPSSVTFHGVLDESGIAKVLASAHVLAMPSQHEGYGIAFLEGMCFGLPVLAASAGAANEILQDGREGFLVEPGAVTTFAEKLRQLAVDRGLLVRLALAARQRYLREPAWDDTAASIRRFLLDLSGAD